MDYIQILFKKIADNSYKVVLFILLFFLIIIAYQTLNIEIINNDTINVFVLFLITIVYFLFLIKIKRISENLSNNHDKIAIILTISLFILLVSFSLIIQSIPYKDLLNVLLSAKTLINTGTLTSSYFSEYSNNLGLLYLLGSIYKLASMINFDSDMLAYIVNALAISVSAFFTYLSVKEVSNKSTALTLLIFLILNPLLYLYVTYYYTDFFVTPFMSIVCYLLLKSEKQTDKMNKNKFIMLVLAGLIGFLGYKIRATAIFIIIAFTLTVILKDRFKIGISKIFAIFIGIIFGFSTIFFIEQKLDINLDTNKKFPATHWIMMGNNYESKGQWNAKDYKITSSQENYSNKKKVNIQELKNRIKMLTIKEYKEFILEKMKINWSTGDSSYLSNLFLVKSINKSYEYIAGNKTIFLSYILQSNRLILYMLMILSLIYEVFFSKKKEYNFIIIAVFGAFLFYTFWEVTPRYSASFIFLFVLFAGYNFDKVSNIKLQRLELAIKNKKTIINIKKTASILKISLLIITILYFAISYGYYTNKIFSYRTKAVYSFVGTAHMGNDIEFITQEKTIVQSFKTKRNFNSIVLRMYKIDDVSGEFSFKLLDSDHNVIFSKYTDAKNIKNDSYLEYNLPHQIDGKDKLFYIELSSNIKEDKIGVRIMNVEGHDYIPSGDYKVNNKKEQKDLQINVNNKINNTLLSKRVYLMVVFLSIIIELFALGYLDSIRKIIKNKNYKS